MVKEDLGADRKPVYNGGRSLSTKENFDGWFRDRSYNRRIEYGIELKPEEKGFYSFKTSSFFPINEKGFGNYRYGKNYHFTFELHWDFIYKGGEIFKFSGDDDVWVFINNKLVIDLGGVHGRAHSQVMLDGVAKSINIKKG